MEFLGDNTLAAFMKSNASKDFKNQPTQKNVRRKANASSRNKDESNIGKYFEDSLQCSSKNSREDKENSVPNKRLKKIGASKSQEKEANTGTSENCVFSVFPSILPNSAIDLTKEESVSNKSDRKNFHGSTISTTDISRICTQDHCKLSSWGLPLTILRKYESRGVTSMFPWQVECLSNRDLLERNRNLVYSAPTSAGKTLVSEILIIKTVMERHKKVIFILPFVSVVREKMYYFQDLLSDSGLRVEGFMGGCAPVGGFASTDVAIATIEKANSLINQLMEEGNLVNLGAVVIDELHLLGDPYRGYLLELLLTKLKYMTLKEELVHVQLIGMSATLPNLALLAEWLNAELYKTDFRPVPLNELCKIGSNIYDNKMKSLRTLPNIPNLPTDSDNILQLCLETISGGHSILIFCPTKNWCEKLAQQVSLTFCKLGREDTSIGHSLREQLSMEGIMETLEQLKRSPAGLDSILKNTVSFGAAFHHAGLTMDERDVIEGAFRSGALRVLTATSTLSSGVNLPARRVIIRSLMFHGKPLDILTYKQMIGRAGRMGKDTAGESILICKANETKAAATLLSSDLQPIESCLEGSEPLIRALLEAVASEVAYTAHDIDLYIRCTLVSFTNAELIEETSREAIKFLVDNELLMLQTTVNGEERWVATPLGKACLAASMPPTDGLFLFDELQKARRCFVLDTELHVIYLVTPLNSSNQIGQIDWIVFLDLWKKISESERRVGQLVGVEESFLIAAIRGTAKQGKILNVHKRFYTALALHELVREVPLGDVCQKYGCCRGVIQGLQQSAATFAGMITQFCKKLGWSCMELLIGQFQARLQFGVCRDLLDLLRLPMLNGLRARSLFKEGITCVAELAVANELDVERALHKALPFESGKEHEGEHEFDAARRNKMRSVFVTGRDGLTPQEAAIILVREARTLVQNELGIDDVQWKQRQQATGNIDGSRSSNGTLSENSSSIKPPENFARPQLETIGETSPAVEDSLRDEKSQDSVDLPVAQIQNSVIIPNTPIASQNIEISPQFCETSCNDDIFEFSSIPVNSKIENIGTKTLEEIGLEFAENIHPEVQSFGTKSREKSIPDEVSLEFSDMAANEDPEVATIENKTQEEIVEEISIEFSDIAVSAAPEVVTIGTKTREGISLEFSDIAVSAAPEIVTIGTKTIEGIGHELTNPQSCDVQKETTAKAANKPSATTPASLLRGSDILNPDSRSPSLFGDSLNLDTQECNILEQNVIDSLNISAFGDTNLSDLAASMKNTPENRFSKPIRRSSTGSQRRLSLKNLSSHRSPRISEGKNRSKSLVWDDDSWDNTNGVVDKVDMMNIPSNTQREIKENSEKILIDKRLKKTDQVVTTPSFKGDHEPASISKGRLELRKIPQKRKLTETTKENQRRSPIASVVAFTGSRRLSVDSNKSDSDDVVFSSQSIDPSTSSTKNRTKLKLESLRISRTQRDAITKSLKLDEPDKNLCEECSIESVVYNSDDKVPTKQVNPSTRIKSTLPDSKAPPKRQLVSSKSLLERTRSKKQSANGLSELEVVNVSSNWAKFNAFKRELACKKDMALALSCETFLKDTISIGTKIIGVTGIDGRKRTKKIDNCVYGNKKLCGIAVSFDGNVVYYISFDNTQESKVPVKERLELVTEILNDHDLTIRCFSLKETYKMLYNCCRIASSCKFLDPKTADWLLDPDNSERSFNALITEYLNEAQFILQRTGTHLGGAGPGWNVKSAVNSEIRATTESALTWHLTNILMNRLEERNSMLLETFRDIEMGTLTLLARMEITGLGVRLKSLQELSDVIQKEMSELESRAYKLAGKKFNFSSSKSVAQVLGLYKGKKVSTNKAVLENCENPISDLVMSWRKLSTTQIKVVFPLLSLAQCNSRVYGSCLTNTATGRVSMHEPNLQNVPRDFSSQDNSFIISVRMAFVPIIGNVLVSADYCQLELRILAHFSKETNLCRVLKKEGDVFKNIAARWYNVSEEKIDDEMRQRTKQLCYGMIYGMGVKTLAETLSVSETEAKEFLETFMRAYPGIRQWLSQVIEEARADGYVTTLMQRRRFFPALHSPVPGERSQAERQAVNTKVQGSAADIAKKAMVVIDERMRTEFPGEPLVLTDAPIKRKLRNHSRDPLPRGGYLVLQIHDELLYEVNAADLEQVARIIQESMEQSCKLKVPLPVKLKVGPTWGDLTEYKL